MLSGPILYFLSNNNRAFNANKIYIIIICLVFVLISGLRNLTVGNDTITYFYEYNRLKTETWENIFYNFKRAYIYGTSKDPGYNLLVKLANTFSINFQLFLVSVAVFFFTAIGKFLYSNTKGLRDLVFAFVLYVSLFQIIGLSGIRQQIATAFALFSLPFFNNKSHAKFIILILIGSTIHISLLLYLPFYFLNHFSAKMVKYIYFISFLLLPIMFIYNRSVIGFMGSLTTNEYYAEYAYSQRGGNPIIYFLLVILVGIVGALFIRFNINEKNKIYFLAIMLMIIFAPLVYIDGALIRIGQYFSLFMMVFIPFIINKIKVGPLERNLVFALPILILIILSLRTEFEYSFFWQTY